MVSSSTGCGYIQMLGLELQQLSCDCEKNKPQDKTDTLRMAEQKERMKLSQNSSLRHGKWNKTLEPLDRGTSFACELRHCWYSFHHLERIFCSTQLQRNFKTHMTDYNFLKRRELILVPCALQSAILCASPHLCAIYWVHIPVLRSNCTSSLTAQFLSLFDFCNQLHIQFSASVDRLNSSALIIS